MGFYQSFYLIPGEYSILFGVGTGGELKLLLQLQMVLGNVMGKIV